MTKTTNNLIGGLPPLVDEWKKFHDGIHGMDQLNPIDFKRELNTLSAPPQISDWDEYVLSKIRFQMEWELMHKLGCIEKHSELIDLNLVNELQNLSIDDASV